MRQYVEPQKSIFQAHNGESFKIPAGNIPPNEEIQGAIFNEVKYEGFQNLHDVCVSYEFDEQVITIMNFTDRQK